MSDRFLGRRLAAAGFAVGEGSPLRTARSPTKTPEAAASEAAQSPNGVGTDSGAHAFTPRTAQGGATPRTAQGGGATPRLQLDGRLAVTPGRGGSCLSGMSSARAAQEGVMAAVRTQLEALDEKFGSQLARISRQNDRARDTAWSRADAKISVLEAMQPRLDKRVAELGGHYKGLSDEVHSQIRRLDDMDVRLAEFRQAIDEDFKSRFEDLDQAQLRMSKAITLMNSVSDEAFRNLLGRVQRVEGLFEEQLGPSGDTAQLMALLEARLAEVERDSLHQRALNALAEGRPPVDPTEAPPPAQQAAGGGAGAAADGAKSPSEEVGPAAEALDSQLSEACGQLEARGADMDELRAQVEAQDERLRCLRVLVDGVEERLRQCRLGGQEWEGRARELQSAVRELEEHRIRHEERLEISEKTLESCAAAEEEFRQQIRRVDLRCARLAAVAETTPLDAPASVAAEVGPQLAMLVESLRVVAPKVVDHESRINRLREQVEALEAGGGASWTASGGSCAGDGHAGESTMPEEAAS